MMMIYNTDTEQNDLSDMQKQNQGEQLQTNAQTTVKQAVENPYYAKDDFGNAPTNETHLGSNNVVNIKVTQNPYYEM